MKFFAILIVFAMPLVWGLDFQPDESTSVNGLRWTTEVNVPATFSSQPDAGQNGEMVLTTPIIPNTAASWVSAPIPIEANTSYQFSASILTDMHNGMGGLALVFLNSHEQEVAQFTSRHFVKIESWDEVKVSGLAPRRAHYAQLRVGAGGIKPDARGQVLMANASLTPTLRIQARFPQGINVIKPFSPTHITLLVEGKPCRGLYFSTRLEDIDGNPIQRARQQFLDVSKKADLALPKLLPGYYSLYVTAASAAVTKPVERRIPFAVLSELTSPPTPDTFIALDAGMSWEHDESKQELKRASQLAQYLGIRMCRDRMSWNGIETAPGQFNWGIYAQAARIQHKYGISVYQVFHDVPIWSVPPSERDTDYPHRYPPADPMTVYQFTNRLVHDLGRYVDALEIWNEADHEFFLGRPEDYAAMLKAAYLGAKDADPTFGILISSETRFVDQFFPHVYENGVADYFDINNTHSYQAPETLMGFVDSLRQRGAAADIHHKPIWITEMGKYLDPSLATGNSKAEWEQCSYLVRAYACAARAGVSRFFYFKLGEYLEGETLWGILDKDLAPRPAYVGLGTMVRQLGKAKCIGWLQDDGLYVVVFNRNDGEAVALVWNTNKERVRTVPLPENSRVLDIIGRELAGHMVLKTSDVPHYIRGLSHDTIATLRLNAPEPTPQWNVDADPNLEHKRVWLQLGVDPEAPRLSSYPVIKLEKAGALIEPDAPFTIAAWAHNYSNQPVRAHVRCEGVPTGLRCTTQAAYTVQVAPWTSERVDFAFVGHDLIQGKLLRIPFRLTNGPNHDQGVVYVQSSQTDARPTTTMDLLNPNRHPAEWKLHHSKGVDITQTLDSAPPSSATPVIRFDFHLSDDVQNAWGAPGFSLGQSGDLGAYQGLRVRSYLNEQAQNAEIWVEVREASGGAWRLGPLRAEGGTGWVEQILLFDYAEKMSWQTDDNERLDVNNLASVTLSWSGRDNRPGETVSLWLDRFEAVAW